MSACVDAATTRLPQCRTGSLLVLVALAACALPARAQHEGHASPAALLPAPLTDADRAAAFPDLGVAGSGGHMAAGMRNKLLLDRLEWQDGDAGDVLAWDVDGWIGGDFNRLWLRSEGEREDGSTRAAGLELLYGRAVSRWWELLAGVRHDAGVGPSRDWAALGVQGLAPWRVEVEATAYAGESGRTALRFALQQELRLMRRVVLQPRLEFDLYGKDDPAKFLGSGLATAEAGLRLRYEIRREFAPYLGVSWQRSYGDTADLRRGAGEAVEDTRLVAGLRAWF